MERGLLLGYYCLYVALTLIAGLRLTVFTRYFDWKSVAQGQNPVLIGVLGNGLPCEHSPISMQD